MKTILTVTASCMIFLGCTYDFIYVRGGSNNKEEIPKATNHIPPPQPHRITPIDYHTLALQNPIILTRMDIKKKKAYIHNATQTLKRFRRIIGDMRSRGNTLSMDELSRESHKYMEAYVKPLITDPEANENPALKIETATLYLLCAFLYVDIAGFDRGTQYLNLIKTRYGENSYLHKIRVDQKNVGFSTLHQGIMELQKRMPVGQAGQK